MTSPNVGGVEVEILASARELARSLKKEVESAFKGLDLKSAISQAIGDVKVSVSADTARLRQELGAQVAAAARAANARVPLELADEAGFALRLRAAVARASSQATAKVKVDVDQRGGLASLGTALRGIGNLLPNIGGVASSVSDLGGSLQRAAGSSAQLGGSLVGAFSSAAGPVGVIISLLGAAAAAMAGLGVAAALVVPAISAVAGAAAAIPAALAGAGAVIGTLALGFKGISAAFKPKAGGGGGGGGGGGVDAASQARRVAQAERGVESARRGQAAATRGLQSAERGYRDALSAVVEAEKRYAASQQAVSRARKEAVEDIDDLNRSLRGAVLSEEESTLAVEEALRALNEAKLTGNIPDIKRADLAYRQSLQTLDEAKDTTDDLTQATDEANTKGVEGSDKVQEALAQQVEALNGVKQAHEGVLDAQNAVLSAQDGLKSANDAYLSSLDSLAEAQKKVAAGGGGGGGLGQQLVKLAPAAQRFVDAIKALKPAFESLRLDVQQRLFAGLDKTVTRIGETWIPALRITLGRYADTFNGFFRNLGTSITTPKFVKDIQIGAEGARQGLEKIGASITTSLVPAFGALSRAAGPFLAQLGTEIADIVTDFSNWVLEGEKTGGLKSFFATASEALHDIFTTGKLVAQIVGTIIRAILGPGSDQKTPIDSLNDALASLNGWLSKPEVQAGIRNLITDVGNLVKQFVEFGNKVGAVTGWIDKIFPPGAGERVKGEGAGIGRYLVAGLIVGIGEAMEASLKVFIKTTFVGGIITLIKGLFGIKSPSTVMAGIGGDLVAGLIKGIRDWLPNLSINVGGIKSAVVNKLRDAGSWLTPHGGWSVDGLRRGFSSRLAALQSTAAGARSTVMNALRDAGNWLYGTGRNIVIGLGNGIASLGNWLWNKAVALATSVKNAAKAALGIASPSKVMAEIGGQVAAGLAAGMADGQRMVASAADGLANAAVPDIAGDLLRSANVGFDDLTARLAVATPAPAPQQVLITVDRAKTGDWLVDGLRQSIKGSFRGDPVAALGSN